MRVLIAVAALHLAVMLSQAELHHMHTRSMASRWQQTGWRKGSRVPEDQIIQMSFGLAAPQAGVTAAEAAIQAISDPASDRFGQYLSVDDVSSFFAPSPDQIREMGRWLNTSGIPRSSLRITANSGRIFFNATAKQAEQLVGATYFEFHNGDSVQLASESLSLPPNVSEYVDVVLPGIELGSLPSLTKATPFNSDSKPRARQTSDGVDCFQYMTPDCYRSLYNMPALVVDSTAQPNNSLGTFQVSWQTWLAADLDAFFARYQPEIVGRRPQMLPIDGGYTQELLEAWEFNLESNLDLEYTMSLAYPLPVTDIQVGDEFLGGNPNTMLAAFDKQYCDAGLDANFDPIYPDTEYPGGYNASDCGVDEPPLVISMSYVWDEASFSDSYLRRQCLEYLKLGLRGVSVIVSSGDTGTSFQGFNCIDPATGQVLTNLTNGFFTPGFPATCPWVTTVGGTQLTATNASWTAGTAWESFPPETAFNIPKPVSSSGGGFSRVFDTPFYQLADVAEYLNGPLQGHLANLSAAGYFNDRGRGFPDVAAIAAYVLAQSNDVLWLIAGTSASAPVFASMIAKINDARLAVGKCSVGFLNPVLYGRGRTALSDVTLGWNAGCGVEEAFGATAGWDAVTGLGSPNFEKLLELYLSLP
jgi:tripeptidyl-peptidase I